MSKKYLFADEAGCFSFNRKPNVSRYFIICTVLMDDLNVAADLVKLRRKMIWDGLPVGEYFHATKDKQEVRDGVYEVIQNHNIKIQATICEKAKAQPSITKSKSVRRQGFWFQRQRNLSEYLAHLVGFIMRQTYGVASAGFRAFCV